ncbi:MAG TPA: hypothetical protein VFA10_17940 [Ktedonobacteraceae bacterium]|nr:hypothetical protein [Ktedonobacteraceae bacterium]
MQVNNTLKFWQRWFAPSCPPALVKTPSSKVTPLGYLAMDWQSRYRWVNVNVDAKEGERRARTREYHIKGRVANGE